MHTRYWATMGLAIAVATGGTQLLYPSFARADDYSELLDILLAKGSLSHSEYTTLLAHHLHRSHAAPAESSDEDQPVSRHGKGRHMVAQAREPMDTSLTDARMAAASAAESAKSAREAMLSTQAAVNSPSIVRVAKYVPGKGITFHAGEIDINISGFVNGFYTYNSPGHGTAVAGGISSGSSKFDSSAVRNGLLPGAIITKLSTVQEGIDISAVFGMYPGLNNATNGSFNANSGGSPVGLGTSGVDFRQVYITAGTKSFGTVKIGRDIGLFGSEAILNDATLLSVGSTGSNSSPSNTSLGRIGAGYVYTDWIPQISYISPVYHGFQGTIGVMQPLDEFNYAGGGLSASSTQHSTPMVQGKLTYDVTMGDFKARIWGGFLMQHQQDLTGTNISTAAKRGAMVEAGEIGTKVDYGPFEGVVYYYRGSGLGTTGLFFDGVANNGRKRDSEGYYVQGSYKITKRFRIVGSYGTSNLYQAPGENNPLLVRRNESEIGAVYYNLTSWLTLVGEYAHTRDAGHGPYDATDNSASGGAILFF